MARVAVFVPDLLFGSTVLEIVRAAGHEPVLCGDAEALGRALAAGPSSEASAGTPHEPEADAPRGAGALAAGAPATGARRGLVVDLTADAPARLDALARLRAGGNLDGVRTIAFYSHVDADVRTIAEQAGLDVVVPRSRMAREGVALIERALA